MAELRRMVKKYTSAEVDCMIVARYRKRVTTVAHPAFITYEQLGKLFKCSGSLVRKLTLKR